MAALLIVLALLQPQDPKKRKVPLLHGPIENWRFQHFERNARGEQVLVAELRGDTARPLDDEKQVVSVGGLRATYYTEPTEEEKSRKLSFAADEAIYDDPRKLLRLRGHVRVNGEDGSEIEAAEIEVDLGRKRFRTEQEFRLATPALAFTGRGLEADDSLRELSIRENGRVAGRPADPRKPSEASKGPHLVFLSPGRMTMRELQSRRLASLEGTGGTRIRITDAETSADIRCESASLVMTRFEKSADLVFLHLRGNVNVESSGNRILAGDARIDRCTGEARFGGGVEAILVATAGQPPIRLMSDRLVQWSERKAGAWSARSFDASGGVRLFGFAEEPGEPVRGTCGAFHYDLVEARGELAGNPRVVLARGADRISARQAAIDERSGRTVFSGDVEADLVQEPGREPVHFVARELVEQSERIDNVWRPAWVEASGDVRIRVPGGDAIVAECETFRFDLRDQAGVLTGRPWVRLSTKTATIHAARVVLPDRETMILSGPKRIRLAPDGGEPATILTDGDVRIGMGARTIKIVDRCSVFAKDSRVFADRVDVRISPDGKSVESIRAAGRVEVVRPAEGLRIFGDRMAVAGDRVAVRGLPYAVLEQPSMTATMAEVRFDPKTGRAEMFRGKDRIRFRLTEEPQR
ncbi:MAG: LPS export ABC transporter periplasmic protein LptC [Planctomycetes bacterium]|nr:LPS export ABC transporter periplasmic protein LptC [Planctomycetota bacterium]